jgi:hypothetical protein
MHGAMAEEKTAAPKRVAALVITSAYRHRRAFDFLDRPALG